MTTKREVKTEMEVVQMDSEDELPVRLKMMPSHEVDKVYPRIQLFITLASPNHVDIVFGRPFSNEILFK